MNKNLLDQAVQNYINASLSADINQIALAKSRFEGITSGELAEQITAKKKSEKKLPTWFNTPNIYYPPPLSIEQTSSEKTAKYKAKLVKGDSLIDLTGGFGVDSFYFAKETAEVIHCEINAELSAIVTYNYALLNAKNIQCYAENGIELIKNGVKQYGTVYIDPARRAEKGKVFMLKDCSPDVVSNLDTILEKTSRIIIKTAPLLDISAGLLELKFVSEIHIVSVKNECKEILWVIDKDFNGTLKIIASTLNEIEKYFVFLKSEAEIPVDFIDNLAEQKYLYEPDVALLKSGAFNLIAKRYELKKLHPQTQLYASNNINRNFPGRIFEIKQIILPKDLKKKEGVIGNVIVRNYPAKPEELVKKYKIKSAKEDFLIFTKTLNENNVILRSQIVQYY
ncbi:class I SAM-dependent methyltransferase [Pedobacter mucosus]|uniref:class I SAM-dependent methyltransferase n=1 Tax=Pedobacter mucosus TaxID=2895286 RepID=UPI001EE4EAC1|nr:class I SAM-dependent methyltransferase [Pedobacter mucosus]UKT65807.1 class I SAM-dependent methyltransferase [Pedobacter mucosus]